MDKTKKNGVITVVVLGILALFFFSLADDYEISKHGVSTQIDGFDYIGNGLYKQREDRYEEESWKTVEVVNVFDDYIEVTQGDIDAGEYVIEKYNFRNKPDLYPRDKIHFKYEGDKFLKYYTAPNEYRYELNGVIIGFEQSEDAIDGEVVFIKENETGEVYTAVISFANFDQGFEYDFGHKLGDKMRIIGEVYYFQGAKNIVVKEAYVLE